MGSLRPPNNPHSPHLATLVAQFHFHADDSIYAIWSDARLVMMAMMITTRMTINRAFIQTWWILRCTFIEIVLPVATDLINVINCHDIPETAIKMAELALTSVAIVQFLSRRKIASLNWDAFYLVFRTDHTKTIAGRNNRKKRHCIFSVPSTHSVLDYRKHIKIAKMLTFY